MANELIKQYAKENKVFLYEVTHELGYKSSSYSSIYFRYELDDRKQVMIYEVIDKIAKKKNNISIGRTNIARI